MPIKKKTLVLDLDETLIHSCSLYDHPDVVVTPINEEEDPNCAIPMKIRPFCLEFLNRMSKMFEIIVYTASQECYANSIINFLDP